MPNQRRSQSARSFTEYQTLEPRNLLAGVTNAISSGDWHSAAIWDNGVPDNETRAVINSGVTVNLAGTDHIAEELVVQGNLVAVEGSTTKTLTTRWIHVNSGGVFQIGTEADRYDANDFVVTLTGEDPTESFTVEGVATPITDNDAFLMAAGGGRLQFFGEDKLSFTKLRGTVEAGATEITVEEVVDRNFDGDTTNDGVVNWEVGDQIVIASSVQDYAEEEVRTITNIVCLTDGSAVITLDQALANRHYGEIETYSNDSRMWDFDMRAEVALLSRNVKFQGLASQDTDNFFGDRARFDPGTVDGFGAHAMIMGSAGQITIDNVQLDRMGQTARLGRYPIHWHLAGDRSGDVIRNSSITNSNNRGLTIHGTHNVRVEGVVLHDIHGHGFFMEDAVETGNEYIANIAFGVHKVGRSDAVGNFAPDLNDPFIVDTHDHVGQNANRFLSSAAYWMTNPDNTWVGNISAGSEGTGFWFIFPDSAIGLSAEDSQYDSVQPDRTNMRQFDFNASHSSPAGLNFDRGSDLEVPVGGNIKEFFAGDNWLPTEEPQINGFSAYHHNVAIYHRGFEANFHDNRIADSDIGTFITFTQRITDTLYVGHSRGNADLSDSVTGHSMYDGANTLDGTHFAGFANNNAHMFRIHGSALRHTSHVMRNTTFEDDGSADHVSIGSQGGGTSHNSPFDNSPSAIYDEDGTLTGHVGGGPGHTIVAELPFFYDSDDIRPDGWNAAVSDDLYAMLQVSTGTNENFRLTAPDGDQISDNGGRRRTHIKSYVGNDASDPANDYLVDIVSGSLTNQFDFRYWTRTGPSGSTVLRFVGYGDTLRPQSIAKATTLEELRAATETTFTVVDGDVYVKAFNSSNNIRMRSFTSTDPIAVDDSATTPQGVAVDISVLANDSDNDGDALSVISINSSDGVVVADYQDDFQTGTPPSGWQYLWNSGGEFGDPSIYSSLQYDTWRYKPNSTNFPYFSSGSAHPGDGTDEGSGIERHAIAAFTVTEDGEYTITDSAVTNGNEFSDGVNVKVHVTGGDVTTLETIGTEESGSFDTTLGFLSAGQTIYIGVAAGEDKGGDASNPFDFSIRRTNVESTNGTVQINADNTLTYIPNPGFSGTDTFTYEISDGRGGFDSAVVTVEVLAAPDLVGDIVINEGVSNSRSLVNQLVVSFDDIVTLQAGAFSLTNTDLQESATVVPVIDNSSGSSVITLTFSGSLTESGSGSLVDGNWLLEIDGSKVQSSSGSMFDGDGDGIAGGIYTFGDNPVDNFFRLFGDFTGDRRVNVFDLLNFRQTYLSSTGDPDFNAQADSNGDGTINVFDLLRFRQNYLKEI